MLTYLLLAGLAAAAIAGGAHLYKQPLPGNQEGYEPVQPIKFSHKQHAGDLQINCLYCHYSATNGPHAGIPPATFCMNCHRLVTASWDITRAELDKARQEGRPPNRIVSEELNKLYDALGLDDNGQRDPNKEPQSIAWVKVHNVPRYTRFDHRSHVNAKVACQECHGPVETMDVIRQSTDLSMGWCVKCHKSHKEIEGRKVSPSTDCAACHY
jgi:hypothetical protein